MKPDIWGKYLWISIHFIAMEYPHHPSDEDKNNYRIFFQQLQHVVPCVTCANNYKDHLVRFPLNDKVMENRSNLFQWTVDMHNEVNKITNKDVVSNDDAVKIFTKFLVDKNKKITNLINSHELMNKSTDTSNVEVKYFSTRVKHNFTYSIGIILMMCIISIPGVVFFCSYVTRRNKVKLR